MVSQTGQGLLAFRLCANRERFLLAPHGVHLHAIAFEDAKSCGHIADFVGAVDVRDRNVEPPAGQDFHCVGHLDEGPQQPDP